MMQLSCHDIHASVGCAALMLVLLVLAVACCRSPSSRFGLIRTIQAYAAVNSWTGAQSPMCWHSLMQLLRSHHPLCTGLRSHAP